MDGQPTPVGINDAFGVIVNMHSSEPAKVAEERSGKDMSSDPDGTLTPEVPHHQPRLPQSLDNSERVGSGVRGEKHRRHRRLVKIPVWLP
jgi:hypothetical protein